MLSHAQGYLITGDDPLDHILVVIILFLIYALDVLNRLFSCLRLPQRLGLLRNCVRGFEFCEG
jgi:hypothetical protein